MLQCPFLIVTLENEKYLSKKKKRQQYEFCKSIDVKTKSTGVQGRIFTENFYALKRLNVVDLDLNSIAFKIGT